MLQTLYISNYALIDELSINFYRGLNIITGETGAGKSIILGALGLMIGQRADTGILHEKNKKCLVEGTFDISEYNLKPFFEQEELDFDEQTILRREITPSGKSRAFINDTPVNLKVLREFTLLLVDIHSQHQNLELGNRSFQLKLVDLVADNGKKLQEYSNLFKEFKQLTKQLDELKAVAAKTGADLDYFKFQFQQLDDANLDSGEQEELEKELKTLEHAEDIKSVFIKLSNEMDDDQGVLARLKAISKKISGLVAVMPKTEEIFQRLESSYIDLKDLAEEANSIAENIDYDPDKIQIINDRLNLLNSLEQKFRVSSVQELIDLKNEFDEKIQKIGSFDDEINQLSEKIKLLHEQVYEQAKEISLQRRSVTSEMEKNVIEVLKKLGMNSVAFKVQFETLTDVVSTGFDEVSFLFSANKNAALQEISKIASGGEISRLMLALKTLMTSNNAMPTIIFDEIDSGISGEIAVKMGSILRDLSKNMQVINITHLPQVAAKGQHHFKVYKYDDNKRTYTSIRKLDDDERIEELAQMLGGEQISDASRSAARELID